MKSCYPLWWLLFILSDFTLSMPVNSNNDNLSTSNILRRRVFANRPSRPSYDSLVQIRPSSVVMDRRGRNHMADWSLSFLTASAKQIRDAIDAFPMPMPFTVRPITGTSLSNGTFHFAHNAYNGPGSLMPNQRRSIGELLAAGVKGFSLDMHLPYALNNKQEIELCHQFCVPGWLRFLVPSNIRFADVLAQFREYVDSHPDSGPIFINFENQMRTPDGSEKVDIASIITDVGRYFGENEVFPVSKLSDQPGALSALDTPFEKMRQDGVKIILGGQGRLEDKMWLDPIDLSYSDAVNSFESARADGSRALNFSVGHTSLGNSGMTTIFEDRTALGSVGYYLGLLGLKRGPFAELAGHISQDDMRRIEDAGINIAELDDIDANDPRLVEGGLFSYIQNSPLLSLGIATSLALFGPKTHPLVKSAIEILSFSLLPRHARIAYKLTGGIAERASKEDINLFCIKQNDFAKAYGVIKDSVKDVAKGELYIFMTQLSAHFADMFTAPSRSNTMPTLVDSFASSAKKAVWANLVLAPPLYVIKNLATRRSVAEGFAEGIDASMLGSTNFRRILKESLLRINFSAPRAQRL